ncbi:polyprenyl synthetase family protein [Microbacterium sediminis]|uniref:Geranylgeranyl pyrophosphate synthase n=1 Tax=Microbacterium sediminis TaxID=904291 RepID=A0A1B9N9A8_9MICO|nr:polyprenyl synthetase family protein [Microbacterium sediminis]OCG73167.1 geranylgeranyl pyrophosphate synthase [Microbacterium sediminis]QBR74516.1 polyprenyl synthetase family protein [Microbacterium sediminis]
MQDATSLVEAISQGLEKFVAARRREAAEFGDEAILIVDHGGAAVHGGKRLRGRFLAAGWHAVADRSSDRPADDAMLAAACALEVFQAAALVHDDIIDNADTRRGRPSAHRALEAAHRDRGWAGDAAAFGRSGAVLLGDLLVAWSDDLLEEALALSPATAAAARAEYALMRREVTMGQFLDVAEESAWNRVPDTQHAERALRVASLKSARYSVERPLLIGAALAGGDDDQLAALSDFGHRIGLAFQLRDDVLGVFGDSAETGKPAGDDLREGKRTALIAWARDAVPASARRTIDELLGDPTLEDAQISMLASTIRSSGALDRAEQTIARLAREAVQSLSGARLDNAAVAYLRDLARAATQRTA